MKFFPTKHVESEDVHSITWSSRYRAYKLSSSGKDVGEAIVSLDQFMMSNNNDLTFLEELNLGIPIEELEVNAYLHDYNLTNVEQVRLCISRKTSDNQLPFGVFKLFTSDGEFYFAPFKTGLEHKNIVDNKNLKALIKDFFENGVEGRKNKKGFLLYGPPGNGKTTEIMSLFSLCEEMKLRIFLVDSKLHLGYLGAAQKLLEQDRTIFIMEEITERTDGRGVEHLLTFLDGENSWNNSVTVATTNYPEDLPANLVDRPGRFDTFIEYGNPTKEDIIRLGEKFGFTAEQSTTIAGSGYSFDYVSYIMSVAKKLDVSLKDAVQIERDKRKKISSTFKGKMGIGLGGNYDDD